MSAADLQTSEKLLALIMDSLENDKAIDIAKIDLKRRSSIADAMVVASGSSVRQVGAMADHLQQQLKATGTSNISIEGRENCDWVLIDAGDIIVHLFRPEVRDFYNIEKFWSEALLEGRGLDASQS